MAASYNTLMLQTLPFIVRTSNAIMCRNNTPQASGQLRLIIAQTEGLLVSGEMFLKKVVSGRRVYGL